MAENEKTSKRVASIAGKILSMENPRFITDEFWNDIKSLAGSAETQTADKSGHQLPDPYLALTKGFPKSKDRILSFDWFQEYYKSQEN